MITTYTNANALTRLKSFHGIDTVEVHAVDHARSPGNDDLTQCGCKAGWPDTSLKHLPEACQKSGCTLGYVVRSYTGKIVSMREANHYDDSDFYATWFDLKTGNSGEIEYASTRGWTYFNGATIDADESTKQAWENIQVENAKRATLYFKEKREAAEETIPRTGKTVRVKSKRSKISCNTVGRVAWFGLSSYSRSPRYSALSSEAERIANSLRDYRIGFDDASGVRHWCSASCVEIVNE